MTRLRERPSYRLTRHFLEGLFDLGFLSDAGTESFKRVLLGGTAVMFALGLLLTRVFMAKYGSLDEYGSPEPYRLAVVADHAFLIALPMWAVSFATVLVGHSLFPDETDFRILMSLPVTKRVVFLTKLTALAMFTGGVALAMHAALAPVVLLTWLSRWSEHAWLTYSSAYLVSSLSASAFALFAMVAIHGVLLALLPRGGLTAMSTALRSLMLCVLVLALPLAASLSVYPEAFALSSTWIQLVPPAWFVGVEQWLLGKSQFSRPTATAALALLGAASIATVSYGLLYRRFDRVIVRSSRERSRPSIGPGATGGPRPFGSPAAAVRWFTLATLRRSVLHQGIVVLLSSLAAGLVLFELYVSGAIEWWQGGEVPRNIVIEAVVWIGFPVLLIVGTALRLALFVPYEAKANWIFRMTESAVTRPRMLDSVPRAARHLVILPSVALVLPVQWAVLGADALGVAVVELVFGWLLIELLFVNWNRIPFTCSYIPGKGFVPQMVLKGFLTFVIFSAAGSLVAVMSFLAIPVAAVMLAVVSAVCLGLRWYRRRSSMTTPLQFEDELPSEMHPLTLSAD